MNEPAIYLDGEPKVPFSLGRMSYFLILLSSVVIQRFLETQVSSNALLLAGTGVHLVCGVMRMRSIGYSPWWLVAILVPLINLVLTFRLFAYPAHYAETKRPDRALKVLTWMAWLFLLFILGTVIHVVVSRYK